MRRFFPIIILLGGRVLRNDKSSFNRRSIRLSSSSSANQRLQGNVCVIPVLGQSTST